MTFFSFNKTSYKTCKNCTLKLLNTHYLLFCFGFKTYLAVIFRKVLIGEVVQIPKIIAHFWSNLLIQIYHHITCKIHSKRRILLINICNYNCTHIFPLIWHLEDLLLISLISWHAQCLVSSKNPNNFHWRGYFFFCKKLHGKLPIVASHHSTLTINNRLPMHIFLCKSDP